MSTRQKWIAIGVMIVVWVAPAAAVTDAQKCEAAKLKVAGKYGFARLKADAKAVKSGAPADYSKSELQFGQKWMDAEIDGGGMCPTNGDAAGVQNEVAAFAELLAAELDVVRFVDNGDGTVTDTRTRLVWEKKDESAGIHDKDNLYQWSTGLGPPGFVSPNGAAFVTFLGTLNNSKSADGTSISGCFAGYCDWRLPTKAELESILVAPCGAPPCINPAFGPTAQSLGYWSATAYSSFVGIAESAWFADFALGSVSRTDKVFPKSVRAVRGGS